MIGIITVFYSENYGSVLQAYALKKYLLSIGHESVFIDTRNKYSSHSLRHTFMSILYKIINADIYNSKIMINKYINFEKFLNKYSYMDKKAIKKSKIEMIVIGSDTVWDVNAKYFNMSHDLFWYQSQECIPVITYAASVANSNFDSINKLQYPQKCIDKLQDISVRDKYSYGVISKFSDKRIKLVCDPTLLLSEKDYEELFVTVEEKGYVAVYLFEELEKSQIKEITIFCKQNKLKLISLCKQLKWCEMTIEPSVENWISYIKNATYVITNTFHGTIFSIIFHKQFICYGVEKKKITEFLSELSLENRVLGEGSINSVNEKEKIDYEEIENKLDRMRRISGDYLRGNISKVKERKEL